MRVSRPVISVSSIMEKKNFILGKLWKGVWGRYSLFSMSQLVRGEKKRRRGEEEGEGIRTGIYREKTTNIEKDGEGDIRESGNHSRPQKGNRELLDNLRFPRW
ncbi:hypothetical protein I7I53_02307 [Histoplasma capsulatum var. duboisii H88]|uniref:Uncharacterized protein n=1 Tax=Ajellomyces capsulatus (strain H88) TaxID=544711 RepID=A0A8A1LQ11_AJEC8|nr:hypothetical protein I7I53_02307 [Histoplasma capsulatum var. duboisii H88]